MKEEKSDKKEASILVYKDESISISVNRFCYALSIERKVVTYHTTLEEVLREILRAEGIKSFAPYIKKNFKSILDLRKYLDRAELKVKEIANAIPFREKEYNPDIKVINCEEYFAKEEDYQFN
jgi:hypothetical protein